MLNYTIVIQFCQFILFIFNKNGRKNPTVLGILFTVDIFEGNSFTALKEYCLPFRFAAVDKNIFKADILDEMAGDVEARKLDGLTFAVFAVHTLKPCGDFEVFKGAVLEDRNGGGAYSVVVIADRVHKHAAGTGVSDADVSDISATLFGGFNLYSEDRIAHITVPDTNIVNSARHFAAYRDSVTVVAYTVEDPDMLAGAVYHVALGIFTRFYGNCIVACIELTTEDGAV